MLFLRLSILILLLSSCYRSAPLTETERWALRATNTEILRDDFGVPHIYGKTDADAVFGLLYAQCEDDFNRVEQNYIWATGRLAEVQGEEALYSDLRANLYMTKEEAMDRYASAPDWLQVLCIAFADGINYYLHTHPEVKPALLTHFEPWMPMYFSEGSIGGDIEQISLSKIKRHFQAQLTSEEIGRVIPSETPKEEDTLLEESAGSNGIALSGELTESGNAMLLINPHTSFFFRPEVHVVSEEGLNAYGAVTWGQFFVYQGFNEKTGWMHTSTYSDIMDEFAVHFLIQDGVKGYYYGLEYRPLIEKEVTLAYRKPDNTLGQQQFVFHRTHHGPLTHSDGTKMVATAIMWDPVNALIQSFTRTKQQNHQGFREMMNIRTNSSNNTVYADADGTIAYYHGNFIPRRDTSFDYTNIVDGQNPKTDWQGLHTVDECMVIVNPPNGWIQNCNSTPFTAADVYSPKVEEYPKYMSRNHENYRGVNAIRLLKEAKDMTLDKLINLAYDPYLAAFETMIPAIVAAVDSQKNTSKKMKEATEHLRHWDYRVSKESIAMTIAHYYAERIYRTNTAPEELSQMQKLEYYSLETTAEERITTLEKVLSSLEEDFGDWQLAWGEVNRYQRIDGSIKQAFNDSLPSIPVGMASSNWGALAAYGQNYQSNTKRMYGTRGNSFVAVVEFGEKVKAKSLLAGGQSGNPNSPHFGDQAQRYADVQFKEVAYYREDVERRVIKKYRPGAK